MNRLYVVFTIIGIFCILTSHVQGVLFADDYIYLYEDGEKVPENIVLVKIDQTYYPEIYDGDVFIRSQIESTDITFYKTNESYIIPYHEWKDLQSSFDTEYETYIAVYINGVINESLYNITITLPEQEDNKTYGDVIGIYRYYNIDIKTGEIDMFKTKIPKTPGFEIILVISSIFFIIFLKEKKIS